MSGTTNQIPRPESETTKKMNMEAKLENRLNINDLRAVKEAFMAEGDGYDKRLSLNKEQFCSALVMLLNKGTKQEYADLFDKIDVTKEEVVDWDKFASHMLLEFYEKDDRVKSTQVPQWKDLKTLPSPHKETICRITFLKNTSRYIGISKEGCVSMWGANLKLQRTIKTSTESCRQRDLWVTHFVPLQNLNKIALAFTSKEIAFYDMSSKLEFNCQYKVQGLEHTPLCLDYWYNTQNSNEAIIVWGDVGGCVNALVFNSANIALFERPSAPAGEKQETTLNVKLSDVGHKYKNAGFCKHNGHTEWVRQIKYASHLDGIISCSTTWNNSIVIGWLEKGMMILRMRISLFQISQGVNAIDYHDDLNLIASAGVNHHVCLWNPYVVSKPSGVLRGHMASVIQVQFNTTRGQLISFSKDKVLRIWDVQLQVCIQRLAGMFPKGPEVFSTLFFDEGRNKLFITFNYQLTMMEMKADIKNRIMTHEKPVVAALYNSVYNQVVSACQGGTILVWMVDTGQKVKQFTNTHGTGEVTTLAQDLSETRLFTGSTDGTVKIWDFNGHCYHILDCSEGHPADIGQIVVLKRSVLVVGWAKHITIFRNNNFKDYHVAASDWKGGQEHSDDILTADFSAPNQLATGAYDGEIVVWNTSSEQGSKHLNQRARRTVAKSRTRTRLAMSRENTSGDNYSEMGYGSTVATPASPTRSMHTRYSHSPSKSRLSMVAGSDADQNEYGYTVTKVLFLNSRKHNSASGCANLVSCGGNGWVRFWNTANCSLIGEYVAHEHAGSVIMATDKLNQYLVTGDVDGNLKVWDISEHCMRQQEDIVTVAPPLKASWTPHTDSISSLEICERNERLLIISGSSDCSVQLWDVYGNLIGVFGQEEHWKIEPYVPKTEDEEENKEDQDDAEDVDMADVDLDSNWEPDEEATEDPANYRINTWESTYLGKGYQELRVKKRERRQPQTIPDLPYLHWERTGEPPAGPFSALDTKNLEEVGKITQPDFVTNPLKYFSERSDSAGQAVKLPALAESLKTAFDEKTLFPKYILDYEAKMKAYHKMAIEGTSKKLKTNHKVTLPPNLPAGQPSAAASSARPKPQRLKPLQQSRASSMRDSHDS